MLVYFLNSERKGDVNLNGKNDGENLEEFMEGNSSRIYYMRKYIFDKNQKANISKIQTHPKPESIKFL